jgi:hypothetical protein
LISGFWLTTLVCVIGAFIAEFIRIVPAIRESATRIPELLVSRGYCCHRRRRRPTRLVRPTKCIQRGGSRRSVPVIVVVSPFVV